jgi:hypothetical protein
MFSWVWRLIGKEAVKKIGLEDNMAETPTKSKWLSKTVWAAIVTAVLGAITPVSTALGHPIVVPEWVISILVGMGLYLARTATTDIK